MALIDRYVANPHFSERHTLRVRASADTILAAVSADRTDSDPVFRRMIALREWPMRLAGRLTRPPTDAPPPFGINNFTLMERGSREIVYGLAGRFRRSDFDLAPLADGQDFLALNDPGLAKLALDVAARVTCKDLANEDVANEDVAIPSTETRIVCAGRSARLRFAPVRCRVRPMKCRKRPSPLERRSIPLTPLSLPFKRPSPRRCQAVLRAQVAELVDALVSGTSGASRGGSSPLLGTNTLQRC